MRRKEERREQGQTNNKAKQHSTPKAVTFPKKNELPQVGLEPTTLYTLDRVLYPHDTVHVHVYRRVLTRASAALHFSLCTCTCTCNLCTCTMSDMTLFRERHHFRKSVEKRQKHLLASETTDDIFLFRTHMYSNTQAQ